MNINADWRLSQLLVMLSISQTAQVAFAENDAIRSERLTGRIDYSYVGHLGEMDDKGRSLVWEATIEGDLKGTIKWWFVNPPPVSEVPYADGRLTFYTARWELWVGEKLLLAGHTAGKTDFRNSADGIWDGHGRVTEADDKFRSLKGRAVYETGSVILGSDPPKSFSGTGMFQIY